MLVIFVSWMLIKRSKNDIFNEVKKKERNKNHRRRRRRTNEAKHFSYRFCLFSFCGTFRCRPLPMQYFMAKKKRRDAISCASHEFHWTFMLTYWTVTTQHSVHMISFKRRWKENVCKRIYALNCWFLVVDRLEWMKTMWIDQRFLHCFFFLLLEYFEHVEYEYINQFHKNCSRLFFIRGTRFKDLQLFRSFFALHTHLNAFAQNHRMNYWHTAFDPDFS